MASLWITLIKMHSIFHLLFLQGLSIGINREKSIKYERWPPLKLVSTSTASKVHDSSSQEYDPALLQGEAPERSIEGVNGAPQTSSLEDRYSREVGTPANILTGRTWENFPQADPYDSYNVGSNSAHDASMPANLDGLQDPSLLIGPWEEIPDVRDTEAFFHGINGSVVTAQVGATANISCIVRNRGDHETVSWVRLRDHHLITVGRQTYSSDDRFTVSYNRHSNEWILHLRFVQQRDAGRYVCQLSTHPPMVFIKTLSITEASAKIEGGPEWIVEEGSVVKLRCSLEHHSQPPEYVFWYHNKTMINFNTNRQVKVENTKNGSTLTLMSVTIRDSGNYTCVPSKADHASVILHVILDDAPAAMQISSTSHLSANIVWGVILLAVIMEINL